MFKRGKNKRGQVTLFIIIAVVVVALGITTYMLWPQIQSAFMSEAEAQSFLAKEGANLKSVVSTCVGEVSEDILREQGMHAGYYTYNHLYALDFAGPKVVVMYKDGNLFRLNELPSLATMESDFEMALEYEGNSKIDSCLNNFKGFKKNMDIEPGLRKITSEIHDEEVVIKVDWPIKISKAGASSVLPQEDIRILMPLGRVWTVANDIMTYETSQTNFILEYENYIRQNDNLMRYTRLNIQNYPTSDQTVYMINTIPHRPGENELLFYFAVDRA